MMTGQRLAAGRALGRPLRPDEFVIVSCKNHVCCNPEHLRIGTREDVSHASVGAKKMKYSYEFLVENRHFIVTSSGPEIAAQFKLTLVQAYNLKQKVRYHIRDKRLPAL